MKLTHTDTKGESSTLALKGERIFRIFHRWMSRMAAWSGCLPGKVDANGEEEQGVNRRDHYG